MIIGGSDPKMAAEAMIARKKMRFTRRTTLTTLLALIGLPARAAVPTPGQTEGPFYPRPAMRFADIDNDLVKIAGAVRRAGGEIVHLAGRVLDRQGRPVTGARVEIWQCDANGRYLHTGDRGGAPRDAAFQGFGHDITDAEGRYRFRTIRPVVYPGRTPHIHVKVLAGNATLTTQFYIDGHPGNAGDVIWRRLSPAERQAVAMAFTGAGDQIQAEIDIHL